ncbi:3-deoxy-D-manno-octulosonic-acid transferase [Algibacter lectus]|uniref:3-deoxy-D-manno-octulosonic acid transferase n=1 Tax=Algibacter lectus TaxID=221126 RepID=A0A090X588_9FLAO|nr:3-deoxy-D-manno-octulosonic-acid transferase [Algibacter lectus]
MAFIYNILIKLADGALRAISPFNSKIKSGVIGRQNTFQTLKTTLQKTDKTLWFHCASLGGEYEQGLPVFTKLRTHYHKHKIVLSFFSPSGYEIRKNSPIADVVIYLPIDTKKKRQDLFGSCKPGTYHFCEI